MSDKIYRAFSQIEASPGLKESTRQYLQAERDRREVRPPYMLWMRAMVVICVSLLICAGVGVGYIAETPVSYVSIDVNPSIELTLNCFDRVIAAAAYNEDAEEILDSLKVKGKLYSDAIDLIVESEAMQPYLSGENILVLTVASNSGSKDSALLAGVEKCHSYSENGGHSYSADADLISEAHEHDMSFGKYAAYCVLSEYDDTITAEDCHDMSMYEIHSRIGEHESCGSEHSESHMDGQGGGHDGTGTGHGNGHGSH